MILHIDLDSRQKLVTVARTARAWPYKLLLCSEPKEDPIHLHHFRFKGRFSQNILRKQEIGYLLSLLNAYRSIFIPVFFV